MKAERRGGKIWGLFAVVAIGSTTLSLTSLDVARSQPVPVPVLCANATCGIQVATYTCSDGRQGIDDPLNCSDLCGNATDGTQCATYDPNLCQEVLCSGGNCSDMEPYVPASCNDSNICTEDTCDPCANNCSGACVNAPLNSTACHLPVGDPCGVSDQCTSTFCVDGVCCDTPCTGPIQSCNVPGHVGQCISRAPAPAASWQGLLATAVLLAAIGGLSLRRALGTPRR